MFSATEAGASIERGDLLTKTQCDFANGWLLAVGVNPLHAFTDHEINLRHRAIALSMETLVSEACENEAYSRPPDISVSGKWAEVHERFRSNRERSITGEQDDNSN